MLSSCLLLAVGIDAAVTSPRFGVCLHLTPRAGAELLGSTLVGGAGGGSSPPPHPPSSSGVSGVSLFCISPMTVETCSISFSVLMEIRVSLESRLL